MRLASTEPACLFVPSCPRPILPPGAEPCQMQPLLSPWLFHQWFLLKLVFPQAHPPSRGWALSDAAPTQPLAVPPVISVEVGLPSPSGFLLPSVPGQMDQEDAACLGFLWAQLRKCGSEPWPPMWAAQTWNPRERRASRVHSPWSGHTEGIKKVLLKRDQFFGVDGLSAGTYRKVTCRDFPGRPSG